MDFTQKPYKRRPSDEILVVDDDPAIREALCEVLADEGFEVVRACNGADAVFYLTSAANLPSLIILDLTMPVMDGYEFLHVRSQEAGLSNIPVLVVSANPERAALSPLAPEVEVLMKPVDLETLLESVSTALQQTRADRRANQRAQSHA